MKLFNYDSQEIGDLQNIPLQNLLNIYSVAGLFKPIDYVNPLEYDSPESLPNDYKEAQMRILRKSLTK